MFSPVKSSLSSLTFNFVCAIRCMNNHSSLQRCFADALAALVFHSQLPPEEVVADDVTRTYARERKQFDTVFVY